MLVGPRPLHPNWVGLGGNCQQRRVERHIVGAVVTITARTFGVDDVDLLDRQRQHISQRQLEELHTLAVRVNRKGAVHELSDGRGWPQGAMHLERPVVARLQGLLSARGNLRRQPARQRVFRLLQAGWR